MGNEQEAKQFFINIIDGIDWFSHVLDVINNADKFGIEVNGI